MTQYVQELLSTGDATAGNLLIPTKILDSLWEEVEKNLVARSLAGRYIGPDEIPGSSVDVNLETADSLAVFQVPESAAFPEDTVAMTRTNVAIRKYGIVSTFTSELLEDSQFNHLQQHVRVIGRKIAENESKVIINDVLDAAGNTVTGGAAITIPNVLSAWQNLEDNDFHANVMLVGPEVYTDLAQIDTFVEADKAGTPVAAGSGKIARVYGMDVLLYSRNLNPTGRTAANQGKRAYVLDTRQAFVFAEKRPVSIDEWEDKKHDTRGLIVSQRFGVAVMRANAISLITTT